VKWTLAAASREGELAVAMVSTKTDPVNQSVGPGVVALVFFVICSLCSFPEAYTVWPPSMTIAWPTRNDAWTKSGPVRGSEA
jgi:hypothetical protein